MWFQEILRDAGAGLREAGAYVGGLWFRLFGDGTPLPLDRVIAAVAIVAACAGLRRPIRYVLLVLLRQLMRGAAPSLRDDIAAALRKPLGLAPVVFGVYLAFQVVRIDEAGLAARLSPHVIATFVIVSVYWAIYAVIEPLIIHLQPADRRLTDSVVDWLRRSLRVAVFVFALAALLQQWGVRIGPLLTGMGIAGVGVALGAKDLFTNLISGTLILLERRFQYGDWIKVAGVVEGTVENIGFRSTRIRQFDDAAVEVPNSALSNNAVVNYTQMRRRRIFWLVGVSYSTSVDQLKQIRSGIEAYIFDCEDFVPHESASIFVRIDSLGDSSIDIMVYCFTRTTKWGEWLEVKERLAYRIIEIVAGAGSSIAFPSTSVYVESLPEGRPEPFVPPAGAAAPPAPPARGAAPPA